MTDSDETPDLVERIETTRFAGSEFLVWLWFKAELFEGEFTLPSGAPLQLWLDSQLLLRSASDGQERIQFTGVAPSASEEAKLALRFDKHPIRARVSLRVEQFEYSLVFDADTFSFGSVKIPALLTEDGDDAFQERIALLDRLDAVWNSLYEEFLALRLAKAWEQEFVPAVGAWARGVPKLTATGYRAMLKRTR